MYYGKAREAMDYFSSLRFIPNIAMNPAEFLLDLATGQVNDISSPDDIVPPKGTSEYERAVIRVNTILFLSFTNLDGVWDFLLSTYLLYF